ncbi:S1C family serine protease [Bacillus rubiinfantis]|uniref:S1C family serine protease n=1 Tax=Bacillus rubiinfantis TaxID=1499680 RepID=UPI0009E3012C|nr:trypsin-like peptidase domain-containing protein [Bacillus rubiinfantis]
MDFNKDPHTELEQLERELLSSPKVEDHQRIDLPEQKQAKKSRMRGFASTLAAGVIGSVLTLAILPNTDYIQNFSANSESQQSVTSQTSTQSGTATTSKVTTQPTAASANSLADTVERVSKAIVGIVNYQQQQQMGNNFFGNDSSSTSEAVESGSGSGVIFQKNDNYAYIVTNNHVIEGASKLEVSLADGEKVTAELVGSDALTDLAVLKIDAKNVSAVAEFGESSKLRAGDQVYAIGNPLGLDLSRTVTQGIVSAVNRSISVSTSAGDWETNVIQTDAAINAGNSGGALINTAGQVIGINSMKIAESGVEGLGFAIPSNDVIPIVNQLIEKGKIDRPYLGVGLADVAQVPQMYLQDLPSNVTEGVVITNIDQDSAASHGGLQVKDVIVSMNGTKITSSTDLRKYLYSKVNNDDEIKFGVYRDGKKITVKVELSD